MKTKLSLILARLSLAIDPIGVNVVAGKYLRSKGFHVFEVKKIGCVEYIRCQNTNAWRKVGRE